MYRLIRRSSRADGAFWSRESQDKEFDEEEWSNHREYDE